MNRSLYAYRYRHQYSLMMLNKEWNFHYSCRNFQFQHESPTDYTCKVKTATLQERYKTQKSILLTGDIKTMSDKIRDKKQYILF